MLFKDVDNIYLFVKALSLTTILIYYLRFKA
jgi:hypothetical protein